MVGKNIMSFLGLVNYLRDYIPLYSSLAAPLEKLRYLDNISDADWTKECQESFESLKKVLVKAPMINFPDFEKRFYLATDASDFGIGAVLYQHEGDEDRSTVFKYNAFVSRSLSPKELYGDSKRVGRYSLCLSKVK